MSERHSRKTQLALICAASTALILAVFFAAMHVRGFDSLIRLELRFRDMLVKHGAKNPPDPRLVFLGIDNESVSIDEVDLETLFAEVPKESADFRALQLISRQWPWPREVYALMLDKLCGAGARVVAFDLMFPKPSANDEAFRTALDRYRDRVIVGSNFVPGTLSDGVDIWEHTLPTSSLIRGTQPLDPRVAFVNFWPDPADEKIRRASFRVTIERLNRTRLKPTEVFLSLAARTVIQAGRAELVPSGADTDWSFRYTDRPREGFRPLSAYQIFVPKYWRANFGGGERIRDKIVVIGPSGNWQQDEHETPFGKMPGPEIHLNAINALLHQAFLKEAPLWTAVLLIMSAGAAAWLMSQLSPEPRIQVLYVLASNAIAGLLALGAYNYLDLYVIAVTPLLAFNLSSGTCFIYEFIVERLEKVRTRRTLERYVSKDVVHELLDNRESVLNALVGSRRRITVLFSDVRDFTTLTESADAVGLVTQLNEYFQRMVRIVFANSGTLDKFIGDGLMAHWGSIVTDGENTDACKAVRAALQMRAALAELNAGWRTRGLPVLSFGIGINSGEAIVGNLGCEEKMEVSVIGDPVNLAARIEGATKQYHVDLLIGEPTAQLLGEGFVLRTIDHLQVKGKTRPVGVFTVLSERTGETALPEWLTLYETGIQLYRQREFYRAAALFEQAARLCPEDWVITEYLNRAQIYAVQPPGPKWTGVQVLSQK